MPRFKVEDIIRLSKGERISGSCAKGEIVSGISTDTRTIAPGELFVAIKGENFDGHSFIRQAEARGAAAAIVSAPGQLIECGLPLIKVDDTVEAYGRLAAWHRDKFDIPVVAVTGSNGKTTTKEMLAHLLSLKFKVLKNEGTENNAIGVPRTLLRLDETYRACVVELGMNHTGELKRLASLARPTMGVITNIGPAHLEFMKDEDTIMKEKCRMFEEFDDRSKGFINADVKGLPEYIKHFKGRFVSFGIERPADYIAQGINNAGFRTEFVLNGKFRMSLNMAGAHNIYNALAAVAVAKEMGLRLTEIIERLAGFVLPHLRMEVAESQGVVFINDCYNSNPQSASFALKTLAALPAKGRRIFIFGDMLELGEQAARLHRDAGRLIAKSGIDILIAVGERSSEVYGAAIEEGMDRSSLFLAGDAASCAKIVQDLARPGDLVMVKGSRKMKMEEIANCFTTSYTR